MTERAYEERREEALLAQVLEALQSLNEKVVTIDGIIRSHTHDNELNNKSVEAALAMVSLSVAEIKSGFPENDPRAHCEFHLDYAHRMKERAEFWREITFELGKYGLLGFLGWSIYALWKAFLMGPK